MSKCHCENIEIGTYDNQVNMKTPDGEWVCIDTCLATEIGHLWHQGIKTVECCCGHGREAGYIGVKRLEDVNKMLALGYFNRSFEDKNDPIKNHLFRLKLEVGESIKNFHIGQTGIVHEVWDEHYRVRVNYGGGWSTWKKEFCIKKRLCD